MKKLILTLSVFIIICFIFSCEKDSTPAVSYIQIQNIQIQKSLILKIGNSYQLKTTYSPTEAPSPTYKWKSSNSSIAMVNSTGIVTAIGMGECTITVSTADGALSSSSIVTVNPIEAEAIILDKTDVSLIIGTTMQLSYSIQPENTTIKEVVWSSTDINIATISDEGVVKAIALGKTTITVTTNDGSFTATCEVTVEPIPVSSIIITSTTNRFNIGEVFELKAVVYPENATYQDIRWSSDNIDVAIISDEGNITTKTQGNAKITAISHDGLVKVEYYIEVGYKMIVNIVNSAGEPISNSKVVAWDTNIKININTSTITDGSFEIFSIKERIVHILVANASYKGEVIYGISINENGVLEVKLTDNSYNSIIEDSTCYLPGFSGRLNPIYDSLGRTYLYATNISINDGTSQPAYFNSTDSLKLEDAFGVIMNVWIPFIHNSVFLMNYRKVE